MANLLKHKKAVRLKGKAKKHKIFGLDQFFLTVVGAIKHTIFPNLGPLKAHLPKIWYQKMRKMPI